MIKEFYASIHVENNRDFYLSMQDNTRLNLDFATLSVKDKKQVIFLITNKLNEQSQTS